MNTYKALVHIICPIKGSLNYYKVTIKTGGKILTIKHVDSLLDEFRGKEITREDMVSQIYNEFDSMCIETVEALLASTTAVWTRR